MKKIYLFIILLIVIVAFAAADYYANITVEETDTTVIVEDVETNQIQEADKNIIQELLDSNPTFNYVVSQRNRTTQLFEAFDLSTLENVRIYKNVLDKVSDEDPSSTIAIYEIHGDSSQGQITYLNLKLKVIDQLEPTTSINEVSNFGYNAFFYNDINNENIGFIVSQVKDNLYGFQYRKDKEENFDVVKNIIASLMEMNI